jgi:phytoene dehydrogenase-like protein
MATVYDAAVIGAGHNGLVTANYLAKAGLSVLVLERRDVLGGAAVTEETFPGCRVDTGAHGIGGLHPALVSQLNLKRHGLELLRADPAVFAPALDGPHLLLWRDQAKTARAIAEISKADAEAWGAFSTLMTNVASVLQVAWSTTPPRVTGSDPRDLWSILKLGAKLRRLGKREMVEVMRLLPMSVDELLGDWFESDLLKGMLAGSAITGLFQGPMASGTAFTLVHRLAGAEASVVRPTTRVRGGVGALTEALASAAREHGVEIRTAAAVDQVIVEDGRATGVALAGGEEVRAVRVVSNADPRRTFFELVGPARLAPEFVRAVGNIKLRGACAKVHLLLDELPSFSGVGGQGPQLNGVISISPSVKYLERAYDDAKYGRSSREPYLEVSIPSVADPGVAPDGRHVVSILAQYAPYRLEEGAWDSARRDALGDTVVRTLAEYAPKLESAILERHVMTPLDLEETFGLSEGNIYHGEHTLDQMFFMRPVPGAARYRTPIERLYLCGAGTHPGGGVTGVPGYNAAREILRDGKG